MEIVCARDTKRTLLGKVVPLKMPFGVGIAPSDICNFKCCFCNQSTKEGIKDASIITWDDFIKKATQIKELEEIAGQKLKILRFIGNGEPLVNKLLPDMISWCVKNNMSDRYEVTTNGSLLTHEISDRLIEAGITRLLISVEGVTKEAYKKICGYNIDMEKFLEQIEYFYKKSRGHCTLYIKTVNVALNGEEEKQKFYDMFSPISDMVSIENIIANGQGIDFDSFLPEEQNTKNRYNGEELKERFCCNSLFVNLNIHSNGDVDACACLYPPLMIGNINNKPLKEIWNGSEHKNYMIKHLTGQKNTIEICSTCKFYAQDCFDEDDLDPYCDEILERVKKL